MERLEFLHAIESGLDRDIVGDSSLEKLVYELCDEGSTVQYAIELVQDQKNDIDCCIPRLTVEGLEMERVTRVTEAVKVLFRDLNVMGNRTNPLGILLYDIVSREHRTLQQSFMRELSVFFNQYSKISNADLRNEKSVEYAKKIVDSTTDCFFPFI